LSAFTKLTVRAQAEAQGWACLSPNTWWKHMAEKSGLKVRKGTAVVSFHYPNRIKMIALKQTFTPLHIGLTNVNQ